MQNLLDYDWYSQIIIIGQVIFAIILGGILGYERETAQKPAGIRTHMLVSGTAALYIALSRITIDYYHKTVINGLIQADLLRVIAAIVIGVGFLGAGAIFKHKDEFGKVMGLTTAASIWLAAAVGIAVGVGQLLVALGITLIGLIILHFPRHH